MTQYWPVPQSFETYFRRRLAEESDLARNAPNAAERMAHLRACRIYRRLLDLDETDTLAKLSTHG